MRLCKKSLRNQIIEYCLNKDECTIDLSQLHLRGDLVYLIGKTIYHRTKELDFDAIGGFGIPAIPLVAATTVRYWRREHRVKEGFWIDSPEESVTFGSEKTIEGRLTKLHKAIVIEGVCTTGIPSALTLEALQDLVGCKVVQVLALVDWEKGAREMFREKGIKFDSIFKAKKLLDIATNGRYSDTVGAVTGDL